jgi:hypothetical protein
VRTTIISWPSFVFSSGRHARADIREQLGHGFAVPFGEKKSDPPVPAGGDALRILLSSNKKCRMKSQIDDGQIPAFGKTGGRGQNSDNIGPHLIETCKTVKTCL